VIEHLEQLGAWLMNGADDSAATLRQRLQQQNALITGRTVQSAVSMTTKKNKTKHTVNHTKF
jgi:hypothetical protein